MTFNDNANIDVSKTRMGGKRGVMLGGGGIVGVIAVLLISQFLGVDLSGLLGADTTGESSNQSTSQDLSHCTIGAAANEYVECRMAGAFDSIDTYWAAQMDGYRSPGMQLFSGQVGTACGSATSAVGPFYCPGDETIYIDTDFFEVLQTQLGASGGPLAQMYIVAHEAGHHISNLTGDMATSNRSDTGPNSDAVKLELQADCYAGAWVGSAATVEDENGVAFLQIPTQAEIADALNAAESVGDDRIQAQAGSVNPETWTHGSSEQRQQWFMTGYENGATACNTFAR